MQIHKEGRGLILTLATVDVVIMALLTVWHPHWTVFHWVLLVVMLAFMLFFLNFFRVPKRTFTYDRKALITPADGTVCNVEEVYEEEYLNSRCLMVSVFMYGTDVHQNRYPCSGKVEYVNYQKGNYFKANFPKSSELNERCSIGLLTDDGDRILIRQIAGFMARRIVCYAHEGDVVQQNDELGFIKFGSRVDLFLPLGTKVIPPLHQQVYNALDRLAVLPRYQQKD